MPPRKTIPAHLRQPAAPDPPQRYCRDCAHAYDFHSPALDGHMILCRCPHDERTERGKWCIFTRQRACDRFTPNP